jgi:hypothetical protein
MIVSDETLREIAKGLPKYPPLKPGGDEAVDEVVDFLSPEDLQKVYDIYVKDFDGRMKKTHSEG